MSHGFELKPAAGPAVPRHPAVARLSRLINVLNSTLLRVSMAAMILTALILTYSVFSRYFFNVPTDWQDEASVFMLVGVTFFCTAYVQSYRGHIGIEALASLLSPTANRIRAAIVDVLSLAFCAFFSWKSWTLWYEAFHEGQTTSSTFAPPLWIPYGMMALGMSILTLQLLVQVLTHITNGPGREQP